MAPFSIILVGEFCVTIYILDSLNPILACRMIISFKHIEF